MREYRGSKEVTSVTVIMWLSSSGEDIEGVPKIWCDGLLDINEMSKHCGL
jgi:hypothetical protein